MKFPEYTILVVGSILFAWIMDFKLLKTKTLQNPRFWYFLGLIVILQTIVDNWLNGRWWLDGYLVGPYGESFFSGIKILSTPLENYLYGIALIWMNVSFFEFLRSKNQRKA